MLHTWVPDFTFQVTLHTGLLKGKGWTNPVVEQAKDTAVTTKVNKIFSYFNWVYSLTDYLPKGILISFIILWSTKKLLSGTLLTKILYKLLLSPTLATKKNVINRAKAESLDEL